MRFRGNADAMAECSFSLRNAVAVHFFPPADSAESDFVGSHVTSTLIDGRFATEVTRLRRISPCRLNRTEDC